MQKFKLSLKQTQALSLGVLVSGVLLTNGLTQSKVHASTKVKKTVGMTTKHHPKAVVSYFNLEKLKKHQSSTIQTRAPQQTADYSLSRVSLRSFSSQVARLHKQNDKTYQLVAVTKHKAIHNLSYRMADTNSVTTAPQYNPNVVAVSTSSSHVMTSQATTSTSTTSLSASQKHVTLSAKSQVPTAKSTVASLTSSGRSSAVNASSGSVSTTFSTTTKSSPQGDAIVQTAQQYLGYGYSYGGTGQNHAFDCSGLTQVVFAANHVTIPRVAQDQYTESTKIDASQLKKGDLVFFGSDSNSISHVGIYIGNGQMLDAQDNGVITEAINAPWWNIVGYGRYVG